MSLSLEKIRWATIDKGSNPRGINTCFYELNKLLRETKREQNFAKEQAVNSIKCVRHIKFNQHTFLPSLFACVDGLLNLNNVIHNVPAFNESALRAGDQSLEQGLDSVS